MSASTRTDITVVIACHAEDRWESIEAALTSLRKQSLEPRGIVVAVDNNEALAARLRTAFDWISVVVNDGPRGASPTRNRGAAEVATPLTAFLDDDEVADSDWLYELVRPFGVPEVVGTGGRYRDCWTVPKPDWFPAEFAWVVGGAFAGMPTSTTQVRNVWAGNMAIRTDAFRAVGGFRADFGKRGAASQPEDTDLCIRVAATGMGHWMYVPSAVIDHEVPGDRATFSFFMRRCLSEGVGKALIADDFGDRSAINEEHAYVRAVALAVIGRCRRPNVRAVRQALAMLAGLGAAGLGYLAVRLGYRGGSR